MRLTEDEVPAPKPESRPPSRGPAAAIRCRPGPPVARVSSSKTSGPTLPKSAGVVCSETRAYFGPNHGLSSQRAKSGSNHVRELQKRSRANNAARDKGDLFSRQNKFFSYRRNRQILRFPAGWLVKRRKHGLEICAALRHAAISARVGIQQELREISREGPLRRAQHRRQAAWCSSKAPRKARTDTSSSCAAGTSLDLARRPWYLCLMIRSVRIVNRKHAARLGWAVEGVVR
jgi:hypothetical protein